MVLSNKIKKIMKTILNFRNCLKCCLILLTVSFFGCKDNEDPDPRQAYLNTYKMDDFEVHLFTNDGTDSTFVVSNNSEIDFEKDDDLDADELKIELEEFLEDAITESLRAYIPGVLTYADFDDDLIVDVSGNEFDLDNSEFQLTISNSGSTDIFPSDVEGSGEISGEDIEFEFEIVIHVGVSTITMEGTIEGEKD